MEAGQLPTPPLGRGVLIGRYVILHPLGQGGMGVVYAAYDPELNRKIALKLLRTDVALLRERLLREAQTLAQLSHPHVVTVFDVGTCNGQVFIAMEFEAGGTLAHWLAAAPRPWREVLARFLAAGRGLAAAHAAGLVHRDFKPANVLMGLDGRIRVTDFGLSRRQTVRGEESSSGDDAGAALAAFDPMLTKPGGLIGTPAYMAPEQLDGQRADQRSDLFSFCVALYQGLYQERPFMGNSLEELKAAIEAGQVRDAPRGTRVPVRIRRILLRGLSPRPEERPATMAALLEELERDRGKRWRTLALGGVAAAVVATAGYRLLAERSQICTGAERKLAGLWSSAERERVHGAFQKTGKPYAEDAFRGVDEAIGHYRTRWVAMYTGACEATHQKREQSATLLDLRMQCLEERRREVAALTDLFSRVAPTDGEVVAKAAEGARQLPAIEGCAETKALLAQERPPSEGVTGAKVQALENELSAVGALRAAGKYQEGLVRARRVAQEASVLHYRPLEARALYLKGDLEEKTSDFAGAATTLEAAAWAAEAGHSEELEGQALTALASLSGYQRALPEQGLLWVRQAQAVIERMGKAALGSGRLLAALEGSSGTIAMRQSDFPAAISHYRQALTLYEQLGSPEEVEIVRVLASLGTMLDRVGNYAEARAALERALGIAERTFGPAHPEIGKILNRLASVLADMGHSDEALSTIQRALRIQERALGAEHPEVGRALIAMGIIHHARGELEEMLMANQRARAIYQQALGPGNPDTTVPMMNVGTALRELGRYPEALEVLEQARAGLDQSKGSNAYYIAFLHKEIAMVYLAQEDYRAALALARTSLALFEKTIPGSPNLADPLTGMGEALLGLHQPKEAIPLLERALALYSQSAQQPIDLATARFALARALWQGGGDRQRARELATAARAGLMQMVVPPPGRIAALDAWLRPNESSRDR